MWRKIRGEKEKINDLGPDLDDGRLKVRAKSMKHLQASPTFGTEKLTARGLI